VKFPKLDVAGSIPVSRSSSLLVLLHNSRGFLGDLSGGSLRPQRSGLTAEFTENGRRERQEDHLTSTCLRLCASWSLLVIPLPDHFASVQNIASPDHHSASFSSCVAAASL